MDERTEPANGESAAQADPATPPMVTGGPFSRRQGAAPYTDGRRGQLRFPESQPQLFKGKP
jgi:hypothetical protein